MTAYEKELLALAVEECSGQSYDLTFKANGNIEASKRGRVIGKVSMRADALTALLRDLGVEVPERPSALDRTNASIRIEQIMDGGATAHEALHHVAKDDRLAVLALLEGGES